MTRRARCPPAPAPLEAYVRQFDDLFVSLAQRRAFRDYLQGLLLPRERNKTLTGLAGTEPDLGAQAPPAQRLQWFLSEAPWDAEAINARRLELLCADAPTRPHDRGVLLIDETGDRKDGKKTAHVAPQYLGSVGKIANGIVAVSSVWADAAVYYPVHVQPYTPACRLPKGKSDPAFRTKPQIAVELIDAALAAGFSFRAVVADCLYGEHAEFVGALWAAELPFVLALRAKRGRWAPAEAAHTPEDAAREVPWESPRQPGGWTAVVRRFRDGHRETWWAAELTLAGEGPDQPTRLVVATTDPATLPAASTWYLATNLPRPGAARAAGSPLPPADLAEVVRLYGLRMWVEQRYKQVKQELGWADWQVRTDRAIRRHWQFVHCAFSFCWWAWSRAPAEPSPVAGADARQPAAAEALRPAAAGRGKNVGGGGAARRSPERPVGGGAAAGPGLAPSVDHALALVAGLVSTAPAPAATGAA
ncbi:MAG TPA: IS701 family transposase [Longimicrobiaceae bacterium]|nr:IS701 family transposase [Longimicrobiaceae bacterium]